MEQSISFVDANRYDDARSCPGTAAHASGLHPNRSHRISYLLRKVEGHDKEDTKGKIDKHKKNEQTVYATMHSSQQKSIDFSIDLRDQTACFAR